MRNLLMMIIIVALLAVATAGYYGPDILIRDEDGSLVSINENNSAGKQALEQDNVLSENRQIKGRDNTDPETQEEASEDVVSKDGIIISSNLVAGKNARLVIYDEGNRVTGEKVYIDGGEIGETSQTGALTFKVPNKEEVNIESGEFDKSLEVSSESEAQAEKNEVLFIEPSKGENINSKTSTISLDIVDSVGEEYEVYLNDALIDEGFVNRDPYHIAQNYNFFDTNHRLKVLVDDRSYFAGFSSQRWPNPSVELKKLSLVDNYNVYSNFTTDSEIDYDFEVLIGGASVYKGQSNSNSTYSILNRGLDKGSHEMKVLISPVQSTRQFSSQTVRFETDKAHPLGEVEWGPVVSSGDPQVPGTVSMGYRAYTYDPSNYEFIVNGSVVDSRSFTEGEAFPIIETELSKGHYSLQVNISSQKSDEEITAAEASIKVE